MIEYPTPKDRVLLRQVISPPPAQPSRWPFALGWVLLGYSIGFWFAVALGAIAGW